MTVRFRDPLPDDRNVWVHVPTGTWAEMKNPFSVDTDNWVVELQGQIQKSALDVRENLAPAMEKRYGLRADWSGRAFLGNSGGGYHGLMIEADSKVPYAKALAPSAMFNPRLGRAAAETECGGAESGDDCRALPRVRADG